MDKTEADLLRQILDALSERMDKIEARQISTDLIVSALIEQVPDQPRLFDRLEAILAMELTEQTPNQSIVQNAMQRLRALVGAHRTAHQTDD